MSRGFFLDDLKQTDLHIRAPRNLSGQVDRQFSSSWTNLSTRAVMSIRSPDTRIQEAAF